ncbi:MAG: hypothetical protein AB7D39_17385 [Pseudodesulfovibrio sp.]|uniref:hypothetical protein n=1 Tax=Pseudodesulfovibrio sp. TaxID=2035812 RepID=UPI003D0DDF56
MSANQNINKPWTIVLLLGVLAGLYTATKLLFGSHDILAANDNIVWTLPIGSYVFFALTATGMGLLGSLPKLLGIEALKPWSRRFTFMAIVILMGAFISIGLELGSLGHMIYILISPNPTSPIWWMGMLYSVELALLIAKFIKEGKSGTPPLLAGASGAVGIAAVMVLGAVFGTAESRPSFFGAYMPIYTLSMSLVAAWATVTLFDAVAPLSGAGDSETSGAVGRVLTATLILGASVAVARMGMDFSNTQPVFEHVGGVLPTIGLLVALLVMLPTASKSSRAIRGTAAAITLVSVLTLTMSIIISGQIIPVGPKAEGLPPVLTYAPNLWEVLVFVFSLSFILLVYHLGDRLLKLEA